MKNIQKYKEFNEEINMKKALVGGAIALTSLTGCTPTHTSQDNTITNINQTNFNELPDSFTMDQKFISLGTDMSILSNGNKVGKVEERLLSWGKKFQYYDGNGNIKATAKEEVFTFYTKINITDENGEKIGSVEQEIIESMFSIYSKYSIKDKNGKVIAKSKKLDFFTTTVDIYDLTDNLVVSMKKDYINMFGDKWSVNIKSDIDKRLVVFIPSFISSAQSEKNDDE